MPATSPEPACPELAEGSKGYLATAPICKPIINYQLSIIN